MLADLNENSDNISEGVVNLHNLKIVLSFH